MVPSRAARAAPAIAEHDPHVELKSGDRLNETLTSPSQIAQAGANGLVAITAIKVGERHRGDLGDLRSLARSIEDVGLLHPVVVDKTGTLIAGERRLRAFELLGRSEIPVRSRRSCRDRSRRACREHRAQGLPAERDRRHQASDRAGREGGGDLPETFREVRF